MSFKPLISNRTQAPPLSAAAAGLAPGTYHIWTIGCQMNDADTRHLASQLEALGFVHTRRAQDADVTVLNTCVVRQQPEDKAVRKLTALGSIKKTHPGRIIALMGCMVGKRDAEVLARQFPFVDIFLPPSQTGGLIDLILRHDAYARSAVRAQSELEDYRLPAANRGRTVAAFVPVTLGCSHACSYCIIPYRRGPDRSRPKEEILNEIRALVEQGIKEVNLLGQIVDRYGFDLSGGMNLSRLLKSAAEIDGVLRVRFLTSHPSYMDEELIRTVAETEKICPYFELPFQSGSDRILASMRRGYTQQDYRGIVSEIRKRIPDASINTDIIVGYPGETEEDFMETVKLVEDLRLDMHHIAKYSPRPQTAASRMKDDVEPEEKERRRIILDELAARMNTEKARAFHGETVEVLAEEFQEKKNRWKGRTPHNRLVFFENGSDCLGQIVKVKIDWTGPFSMLGKSV